MTKTIPDWLNQHLNEASIIVNDATPTVVDGTPLLGIDLGTSNIVSVVVDSHKKPIAVAMQSADVVRDGVVLDFHGAIHIIRQQLESLHQKTGIAFKDANTSFPPGTDPRISVHVLESAGLTITEVIDEPSAVAHLLGLEHAAVVDIGGGTTGIAVLQKGQVVYSGDEPTGGHHVTLTIAGRLHIDLEEAESLKITNGSTVWSFVEPVFEKMADIVRKHLKGHDVDSLYLSGGSCTLPGVQALFQREFPDLWVLLPEHPIFLTPLAIATYRSKEARHA